MIGKYLDWTEKANYLLLEFFFPPLHTALSGEGQLSEGRFLSLQTRQRRQDHRMQGFYFNDQFDIVLFVFDVPCLKHWLRGLCKKGDQCEFLHEYDMSKMPECYFYSRFSE